MKRQSMTPPAPANAAAARGDFDDDLEAASDAAN